MLEMKEKTLLLVEDEVLIGMSTKLDLENIGYGVIHADTADKAVKLIEDDQRISLVLMDIDLGGNTDGISTAKEILRKKEIPVVFVSSHTEPSIVSSTEKVTSYGYIVKNSNIIAYDASIKVAYHLFTEKKKREIFSKYIQTALENVSEPLFICDTHGDIVFFNNAYLAIQGLDNPELVQRKFEEYKKLITVFSDRGEKLDEEDWASMKPLKGESGDQVIFYVYNHVINRVLANIYTYAPIYDDQKRIIGSYVKIGADAGNPHERIMEKIRKVIGQ